jgi:uncharacterized membrane protein
MTRASRVQWHSMLSAVLPPHDMAAMRQNMAADGWFHIVTWLATLGGVALLWKALRGPGPLPSGRALALGLNGLRAATPSPPSCPGCRTGAARTSRSRY